ncbi:hypothetical protein PGTUg99_005656 [Puccinia graminis f. sp. tritici]|uniref:Uncharacterized protein n=1 Tax=Puccinia graminis f. sp. tritici TaxID=56615 RepID=A0A5B0PGS9_PUCGR|nr:hypothetical protein PGTUg99_005656 [Puccinia graminis f. sp. tritici]
MDTISRFSSVRHLHLKFNPSKTTRTIRLSISTLTPPRFRILTRLPLNSSNLSVSISNSILAKQLERYPLYLEFDLVTSPPLDSILARLVRPFCSISGLTVPSFRMFATTRPTRLSISTVLSLRDFVLSFIRGIFMTVFIGMIGRPHSTSIERYHEILCASLLYPTMSLHSWKPPFLPQPDTPLHFQTPALPSSRFSSCTSSFTTTAMSSRTSKMSSPAKILAPRGYPAISNPIPIADTGIRHYPKRNDWCALFVPSPEVT